MVKNKVMNQRRGRFGWELKIRASDLHPDADYCASDTLLQLKVIWMCWKKWADLLMIPQVFKWFQTYYIMNKWITGTISKWAVVGLPNLYKMLNQSLGMQSVLNMPYRFATHFTVGMLCPSWIYLDKLNFQIWRKHSVGFMTSPLWVAAIPVFAHCGKVDRLNSNRDQCPQSVRAGQPVVDARIVNLWLKVNRSETIAGWCESVHLLRKYLHDPSQFPRNAAATLAYCKLTCKLNPMKFSKYQVGRKCKIPH
jgi:hypothetical protein